MKQSLLFGEPRIVSSIDGLVYQADFLGVEEERDLIQVIQSLPLEAAAYKQIRGAAAGGQLRRFV